MSKESKLYGVIILILVLLAFIVPFVLLTEVDKWYGSFLFWGLFAIAAIIVTFIIALRWKD